MSASSEFYKGVDRYQAIVVGKNKNLLLQLRSALKSIGFPQVDLFQTYTEAFERAKMPTTSHILIELQEGDLSPISFVKDVIGENSQATMVVITDDPAVENAFDLMRSGVKGFLVPPPTMETLEAVFISATKGPPISESILQAEDRNEAFAELILNNLYKVAAMMRMARESHSALEAVDKCRLLLENSVATAKMYCEYGEDNLRDKIVAACIERGTDKKTRLGEVRKALKKARKQS